MNGNEGSGVRIKNKDKTENNINLRATGLPMRGYKY
jgi:hypothetical protein